MKKKWSSLLTTLLSSTPTPTITVTASAASVNEGGSVTLTIETENYAGSTVNFTVAGAGITVEDTDWGTEGEFGLVDGSAEIEVLITADETTEGSETMTITVTIPDTDISDSVEVVINDTSVTPAWSPADIPSALALWDLKNHRTLNGSTISGAEDQDGSYDLTQPNAVLQPSADADGAGFVADALYHDSADLNLGTADGWMACEFKTTATGGMVIAGKLGFKDGYPTGILIYISAGKINAYVQVSGFSFLSVPTVSTYNDGNFHRVIALWDRDGNMTIQTDSETRTGSIAAASALDVSNTRPFYVGGQGNDHPTINNPFVGTVKWAAFGKGGLPTSQEITNLLEYTV